MIFLSGAENSGITTLSIFIAYLAVKRGLQAPRCVAGIQQTMRNSFRSELTLQRVRDGHTSRGRDCARLCVLTGVSLLKTTMFEAQFKVFREDFL